MRIGQSTFPIPHSAFSHRLAQSTLEYAILVAVVAAALIAMHTYVRRAVQANVKNLELELNAVAQD